jgi:O-acetyl-ADP-ribose deacetylase (regulator of RNase III)
MNLITERTADYRLNNTTFRVTYGDITQQIVDALVSSDDNFLSMGGGVSMAILKAGGEIIREEARKHVPMDIGDVAVTSAGKLHAKYIFHAVTIDYTNLIFPSEKSIQAATLRCMQLADALRVLTITFPALGTGVGGFPFQPAAEVMTRTIADYLIGKTSIELVILTLFPRERVKESDLNLFYERAVARASVYTQSQRLNSLVAELKGIVDHMNKPSLSKRIIELQTELTSAQSIFAEKQTSLEHLENIYDQSGIGEISKQIISMSSEVQTTTTWEDKELETEVLRTKLNGLLTQLNIQISHLNRFEIEKAKYGTIDVPPRLETAIEEMKREISETEARIGEVRAQLVSLHQEK